MCIAFACASLKFAPRKPVPPFFQHPPLGVVWAEGSCYKTKKQWLWAALFSRFLGRRPSLRTMPSRRSCSKRGGRSGTWTASKVRSSFLFLLLTLYAPQDCPAGGLTFDGRARLGGHRPNRSVWPALHWKQPFTELPHSQPPSNLKGRAVPERSKGKGRSRARPRGVGLDL
jgi:hypothetical protein